VARALARRLGVPYIDTGAMYRAIGLAAKEQGIRLPVTDPERVTSPEGGRILLDGRDVSAEIRRPEISLYASAVSSIPGVRRVLVREQQRLGREWGGVMEGRDIGTHVFPETPHKFFLTASPEVRARRRTQELAERGTPEPYEKVLREMEKRDRDDGSRADSPLTYDGSYVRVDSGGRPADEVVAEIEELVLKAI
jgi:cytidylate kinase